MPASKNRRRKAYRPRLASKLGGMGAIIRQRHIAEISVPVDHDDHVKMVIAYHQAIDAMTGGYAEVHHFDTIVYALNVGQILAEHGLGLEYMPMIEPAVEAMKRARARYLTTGKFGLDGDGLKAVKEVAGLHEAQTEVATYAELMAAVDEMHRRIAAEPEQRRPA